MYNSVLRGIKKERFGNKSWPTSGSHIRLVSYHLFGYGAVAASMTCSFINDQYFTGSIYICMVLNCLQFIFFWTKLNSKATF